MSLSGDGRETLPARRDCAPGLGGCQMCRQTARRCASEEPLEGAIPTVRPSRIVCLGKVGVNGALQVSQQFGFLSRELAFADDAFVEKLLQLSKLFRDGGSRGSGIAISVALTVLMS